MAYYTFNSYTASNGVVLKVIKTSPKNVNLIYNKGKNVANSLATVAMNGGFFSDSDQLICSIAVNDSDPLVGDSSTYAGGYRNLNEVGEISRGTLAWDQTNGNFHLAVVKDVDSFGFLQWSSENWIQGGVSMNLQNDSTWENQAVSIEKLPSPTASVTRSALLYNNAKNLFLITAPNGCTAAQFRAAIKEKIEPTTRPDGIFLDGAGSPQMKCPQYTTTSETRKMPAIIAVIDMVDI